MKKSRKDKPCVAHYASSYLPLTENWIYRILIHHVSYTPIFLSRRKENLSLFPISTLFSLQDFRILRQYVEILLFRILGYFFFMKKVCVQNNTEILHVHFGYHGVKMLGLKRRLKVPMICSFYGDDAFAYGAVKYKRLFKDVEKVLVLGPYMKSRLISLGCKESKISIHHLGIDVEIIPFKRRHVHKGTSIKFLIASSFLEKKGIDLAIKAIRKFKDEFEFTLDIIGDGPLREDIVNLIAESDLAGRVKLHGYKPYDYFIELASRCDVFIQASRTADGNKKEGTPMAIVDAMATGMAVISTMHSDIPEIVVDGFTGFLAKENDVRTLEECFHKIFDYPERIGEFGEVGRERVEKEFNAKVQTTKLENIYNELLASGN